MQGAKDGAFRATFEDKPLMSDIIFLRAWVAVDLPRFANPVTNLLAPTNMLLRRPKPGLVEGAQVGLSPLGGQSGTSVCAGPQVWAIGT